MKISARNQFSGTVCDVKMGIVNAQVSVQLIGGQKIIAAITKESAENLGIEVGKSVIALVKAPHIMLVTDFAGYTLTARNQLPGMVKEVQRGAINAEVEIELMGGHLIVATVTNESAENLELQAGANVSVVFKAGSVILAMQI
jgi:molybdate transport system regulatory protein